MENFSLHGKSGWESQIKGRHLQDQRTKVAATRTMVEKVDMEDMIREE